MDINDIRKNIKDLEYQYILNMQNILLGFITALIISVIFVDSIQGVMLSKENTLFFLITTGAFLIIYFNHILNKKKESIRGLQRTLETGTIRNL